MKKTEQNSLTYYLGGSAPFHLEMTYEGGKSVDSDPLSRVIRGRIVTDAGTKVKDVLLLVQRDEYGFTDDGLCPITNVDVERAWQQAFSSYLKDGKEDSLLFSKQMDTAGNLARMDSLFFCEKTGLFFSPPCPTCGLPLTQCEDDEILALAGLRSYTGSLRRYLHCGTCSGQEKRQFYVYEKDHLDPADVEDRFGLIKRLASLAYSCNENVDFLCSACRFRDECYGTEQKALSSVVPFAFYPFYMLIVSGLSLNIWNRDQREEKEDLLVAREHALRLGWSLIKAAGTGQNEQWSKTGLPEKLEMLRDGVSEAVSPEDTSEPPEDLAANHEPAQYVAPGNVTTNDDLRRVLEEIGKDWRNRPEEAMPKPTDTQPNDDMEESVETVFLSIADLGDVSSTYTPKKEDEGSEMVIQPSKTESPDHTDKTAILSSPSAEEEIDLERTVLLNVNQATAPQTPPPAPTEPVQESKTPSTTPQADVEETVFISADYGATGIDTGAAETDVGSQSRAGGEEAPKQPAKKVEDDLLEATVILKIDDTSKGKGRR